MLKPIPKSDVVVRPFVTYKNWVFQSQVYDSFLLTEMGGNILIDYYTQSASPLNVTPCYVSYSIALELQDVNEDINVIYGQSSSGYFYPFSSSYYNSSSYPVNPNDPSIYKALLYDSVSKLFYNNFDNPLELFGIQDYASGKEIRNLTNTTFSLINISNQIFGEKIQTGSVSIVDDSNIDQEIHVIDDGYTNLIVEPYAIASEQELGAPPFFSGSAHIPAPFYDPEHDRFGSAVYSSNGYIVVGCPMDENSFSDSKAGSAYLYKFDPNMNLYRFIKKFYSPFSQNGYSTELGYDNNNLLMTEIGGFLNLNYNNENGGFSINDNFGVSVSINLYTDTLFIGSPACDFCESSGSGQVYIYEKYKGGSDSWGIVGILEGSSSYDQFGTSISATDTRVAVGAPGANGGKGRVYIFKKDILGVTIPTQSSWIVITQENDACSILASDYTQSISYLSSSYLLNEGLNVVSSSYNAFSSSIFAYDYSSSLYNIPKNVNWPTPQFIDTSSIEDLINFDDFIEIATEDNTPVGAVSNSYWNLETIIETDSDFLSGFGYSICFSGSKLLVGNNSPTASVYLFESSSLSGWTRTYEFTRNNIIDTISGSSYPNPNIDYFGETNSYISDIRSFSRSASYFGNTVFINNNNILINSPFDLSYIIPLNSSSYEFNVGSVYYYNLNTSSYVNSDNCNSLFYEQEKWSLIYKIYESSSVEYSNNVFGSSISANNEYFIIGCLYNNGFVTSSFDSSSLTFSIEGYNNIDSDGPNDIDTLQGRVFVYKYTRPDQGYYEYIKTINKQKISDVIKKSYGYAVSIDNNNSLAVGSPVFMFGEPTDIFYQNISSSLNSGSYYPESLYISEPEQDFFVEENSSQSLELFSQFSDNFFVLKNYVPSNVSGSVFVYDLNNFNITHSVGNVFYKNGLLIINSTSSYFNSMFSGSGTRGYYLEFNGTHTIYEHEILCTINPGEFNVSTNPTSVVRGIPPYNVTDTGQFNAADFTYLSSYYLKKVPSVLSASYDSKGILIESQNPEQWWADQIVLLESDDVAQLDPVTQPISYPLITTSPYFQAMLNLDNQGLLDINGDGFTTVEDYKLFYLYYLGVRGQALISGNITQESTRKTASSIVTFLNLMTGVGNGTQILNTFFNFNESSSIDPTGSYLAPYITTIGLYDGLDLVAIAKLGQPIKNILNYPINFLVRWDT